MTAMARHHGSSSRLLLVHPLTRMSITCTALEGIDEWRLCITDAITIPATQTISL